MNIANLLQGVASLAWAALIIFIVIAVIRASRNAPLKNVGSIAVVLAVVAILITSVSAGLVFIQPEERGVVISAFSPKGYREVALQPGLRWIIPFAENVVLYPISKQTYTMSIAPSEGAIQGDDSITARTLDGQEIYVDASVIYAIDPEKVVQVHIQWQKRYSSDLVRAQSRGIIRDAVSQYRVDELNSTKRVAFVGNMRDAMTAKLSENGLMLVDFVIRNITFSPEYAASVEQKQVAEQQAQQAKFVVEQKRQEAEQVRQTAQGAADSAIIKAKGDAEARILQAQAEAQSLALISAALKDNPDLLMYQYISKLSPTIQTMLLPSNSPFLFPLPGITPQVTTVP
jgi:regulator of protease activity HflC (stomatin/prohibitin superfamily)